MKNAIVFASLVFVCASAFPQKPQTFLEAIDSIELQAAQARARLRESTVNLRDVYLTSCRMRGGTDCDVAALTDVEIVLMDIENKYRAMGQDKIKDMASNIRSKVDELSTVLRK